jgi:alkylation response protein AidB-like acyl-CoA dehydrogenase
MTTTLEKVRVLLPEIGERAAEFEELRDVPLDVVEKLRSAGVFSRYVPRSLGGQELWPGEGIRVIEEIARADGSVAWISLVGSEGPVFYSYLPAETYDEIYAEGPDVIHAGSISASRGRAVRDGKGYRFSGRWSFASGCTHADRICVVAKLEPVEEGVPPRQLFAVVAPGELRIVDNWFVNGLKATASCDLEVEDLYVPQEWTGSFQDQPSVVRYPLDGYGFLARFGIEHAAMAVGVAQGALEDLIAISAHKMPLGGMQPRLGTDPILQDTVGRLSTEVEMARAFLYHVAENDRASLAGGPPDAAASFVRRARLARVGSVAAAVVDGCYVASGTTGLFESNPLGRRLRDVRSATQHFLLSQRSAFQPAGAAVLGEPLPGAM